MLTKVQIVSLALGLLGQKPITSLENQSNITTAAEQACDMLLPYIISTGQWRFCTKIQQLSQLVATPVVSEWAYIYELPADFLKLIRLYPHNYAFQIYDQNQMYSNVNDDDQGLYLEYQYKPTYGELPYYFSGFLIYKIAEYLALSNAHDVQFSQKLAQDMVVAEAKGLAADAQNRPNFPLISQPIITDRAVSSFVNG